MSYARSDRVLRIDIDDSVGRIAASVAGSSPVPYEVVVLRRPSRAGRRTLVGSCDCPVAQNCKHAAAAALVAAERARGGTPRQARAYGERTHDHDAADGAVDSWLQSATTHAPEIANVSGEYVRYVLDVREAYYVPRIEIVPRVVTSGKNGELGAGRTIDLQNLAHAPGRYAAPIDRTIGRLAAATGLTAFGSVSPKLFATLLDLMLATGRLHWHSTRNPPLRRRDVADARFAWYIDPSDGRQRPGIEDRPGARLLPANPAWYVDADRNEAGAIALDVAPDLAATLAMVPALNATQARRTRLLWHRIPFARDVPPPYTDVQVDVLEREPVCRLSLRAMEGLDAVAELTFAYGDSVVRPSDAIMVYQQSTPAGRTALWPRQLGTEALARTTLGDCELTPVQWPHARLVERGSTTLCFPDPLTAGRSWIGFLEQTVPKLREAGWHIEVDPDFPYKVVHLDDRAWDAEVLESENRWFELDLGVDVDGKRIALLPVIVDALQALGARAAARLTADAGKRELEPLYGRLPDGSFLALPAERVGRIVSLLVELYDEPLTKLGRLELTPAHAASLDQLGALTPVRWSEALRPLRSLLSDVARESPESVDVPSTFKGALRPYQTRGVAWLQKLRRHGFGGVLADDMGLGKTVQFLAHLAIEIASGRALAPVLVVAPTSVLPNWRAEIARFLPHVNVVTLSGADRFERFGRLAPGDVALTSYALLLRDAERLTERPWHMVVLDEAQFVKNPRSKGAQAAARLVAGQRVALTGTPIENHLEELWSIFSFAIPGLLGERAAFGRVFRTPIEKRGDTERRALLAARLRPFLLRRTKEAVALDLPPKTEIVTRVELGGAQRDLYETIRLAMHERVRAEMQRRGLARSRIVVLDALLKLRQVCCDPRLVKLPAARNVRESSKFEALFEMLPELIDEGRRILLFSQFTSMLDLIEAELDRRRMPYVELRGRTRDRLKPVARFQNGEVPLFLISLKAGGTGLNLTAADTVIHYDPWWNPAVERQATDRAHRIGQNKPVFAYKLITAGTVEERILELQERKGDLAAGLFDAAAAVASLTPADIDRLFAP